MATEAPDPRTFKTWDDAFNYPIPTVRRFESQLRTNAADNREKLRSLVGASYRDLLNTAETIIDMEVRMQRVESKLARVGQMCNSRGVERVVGNARGMDGAARARDTERYTFASQLAVLRNCPIVLSRLIKGGSYLLAAKILVLARLLHKALSQSQSKPPFVDQIRDRLLSLRGKLLERIDKQLASTAAEASTLVESMCAYSLATSSTPTDVLRHFHDVRMKEVVGLLQHEEDLAKHGMSALKLCLQTCQDTQAIFPRRLADSLAKLKTQPLAQDPEVRALYELNLDIHDRWIGAEARNYTPWPRHDELQRPEAEKLLIQWSKQVIAAFLKGIKAVLAKTDDLKEVATLRQELIETWILSGSRMPGLKSANVLDDLRDAMNDRLGSIVCSRAQDLKQVVSRLNQTLESWSPTQNESSVSLWTPHSTSMDLSDGAHAFKSNIVNTHQGRNETVTQVVSSYEKWAAAVLEVKSIVKSMKETRWDDTFAEDTDDSDDELGFDSKQTLLSSDDPRQLEEETQEALTDALKQLGKSISQLVSRLTSDKDEVSIPQTAFLLRVLREIGSRIPQLRLQDKATPLSTPFSIDLLVPLHNALAEQTVRPAVEVYERALAKTTRPSASHILWEGNPPLPAQPSPSAFRFLHSLVNNAASHGSDLWAPAAVEAVKMSARKHVDAATLSKWGPTSGEGDADQTVHEVTPQTLFDAAFIGRYVGTGEGIVVLEKASGLDATALARLRTKAEDYARKTYLLFALLA